MSQFHYRAYNTAGETISGSIEADSLSALDARLRSAGVWLLEAREGGVVAATTFFSVYNRFFVFLFVRGLFLFDILMFLSTFLNIYWPFSDSYWFFDRSYWPFICSSAFF